MVKRRELLVSVFGVSLFSINFKARKTIGEQL